MDDLTQERYPGAREVAAEATRTPPPPPPTPPEVPAQRRRVLLGQEPDDVGPAP